MKKSLALYRTIENDLTEKIITEYYKPNELIPTELELTQIYKVSRVTVRKATDRLVAQGLITRTPGYGSVVKPSSFTHKTVEHLSFSEEIKAQGKTPKFVVTLFSVQEATPQIASILQMNEREMVYYFERACYSDEEVIQFEKTYMSIKKYPDLSISFLENSKFHYVEETRGMKIDVSVHTVIPTLPSDRIAKLFNIDPFTPILKVNNTTYFSNGEVMDYTEQYLNSPKYQTKYVRIR